MCEYGLWRAQSKLLPISGEIPRNSAGNGQGTKSQNYESLEAKSFDAIQLGCVVILVQDTIRNDFEHLQTCKLVERYSVAN